MDLHCIVLDLHCICIEFALDSQERMDETKQVTEGVDDLKGQLSLMQRKVVEGEMAGAQLALVTKEKERLETELAGVRNQMNLLDQEKATSEQRWKDQVDATKSRMDELQGFLQEAEIQVSRCCGTPHGTVCKYSTVQTAEVQCQGAVAPVPRSCLELVPGCPGGSR